MISTFNNVVPKIIPTKDGRGRLVFLPQMPVFPINQVGINIPGVGAATALALTSPVSSIISPGISVISPTLNVLNPATFNPLAIRKIPTDESSYVDLHKQVVIYYFNRLKEFYLPEEFNKLLKYIVVEENTARLARNKEEIERNVAATAKSQIKIEYIVENIFTKDDLKKLLYKLVNKYNLEWTKLMIIHSSVVKKGIYRKIKDKILDRLYFLN